MTTEKKYLNHRTKTIFPQSFIDAGFVDISHAVDECGCLTHDSKPDLVLYPMDYEKTEQPLKWDVFHNDNGESEFIGTEEEVLSYLQIEDCIRCEWCDNLFPKNELNNDGHCLKCVRAIESRG